MAFLIRVLSVLAVCMPAALLPAQGVADPIGPLGPGPDVQPDRLFVKLAEGSGAVLQKGQLASRWGWDLGPVQALLGTARIEPLVTCVPPETLDRWQEEAAAARPAGQRPGNLGLWFRVTAPSADAARGLEAALHSCPLVEHVYAEPRYGVAGGGNDLPPTTPPFMAMQLNLEAAPNGLGCRWADGILGGRGQGIRLRMVEDDWILDHEDLSKCTAANFLGPQPHQSYIPSQHGLGGTGELVADRNCFGVTGIVDEVDIKFVSFTAMGSLANGLALAVANSQPGDVFMLVLQYNIGQYGTDDWVPIEYLQAEYDAVATTTGTGRILVCSGGNGHNSLDDPRFMRRFDRTFRDSGAIMVASTNGVLTTRATYSNYGTRIDANGWGENVVTTGYGTLFFPNSDAHQSYTAAYSGTSAATPQVVAVITQLLGAAKKQLGRQLTRQELLNLLATYGTPSVDTIGRRPDVHAMFQALGILDGLEVSAPDSVIGGSVQVVMSGPPAAADVLFVSFTTADLPLGYNRNIHLGLATMQTVGFFPLAAGPASWTLAVPNNAALHGANLYFQAGQIQPSAPIHVSNSCQITVL